MLKQRIISALILVPLVVFGVLKLNAAGFALVVALVMLLGGWEWTALIALPSGAVRGLFMAALLATLALAWQLARFEWLVDAVLWIAMAWWLFTLFWITSPALGGRESLINRAAKAVLGVGLMAGAWLSLVVLHGRPDQGPHWVLYLLVLVWAADSGAYFAGKHWGRTKLAPLVSPGKTWEGVLGGLLLSLCVALGYARFIDLNGAVFASFVLVSLVTVLFSIVGDLLESLLKRQHGIKDSGHLIPGHGGLLDRVDSLLAAAPIFLFGLRWIDL